jgi:hypothetical protein
MRFSILPTPADAEPLIAQVQAAHQAELDTTERTLKQHSGQVLWGWVGEKLSTA